MSTKLSQKDYLKKYLSYGKSQYKKKKKSKSFDKVRVKIIDDNVDIITNGEDDVDEIILTGEDAPQIVGIIDERSPGLKTVEDFRSSGKWKSVSQTSKITENVETTSKKLGIKLNYLKKDDYQDCGEDVSSIQKHADDHYPIKKPRDKNSSHRQERYSGDDNKEFNPNQEICLVSSEDLSPERRQPNRESSGDLSPNRSKKNRERFKDLSSKRKKKKNQSENLSPKRNKANRDKQEYSNFKSGKNGRESNRDLNPKRSKRNQKRSDDLSPKRKRCNRDPNKDISPKRIRTSRERQEYSDRRSGKNKSESSRDLSPKRSRKNRETNENFSPKRKNKNSSEDLNPKTDRTNRERYDDLSNKNQSEDLSPRGNRANWGSREDLSPKMKKNDKDWSEDLSARRIKRNQEKYKEYLNKDFSSRRKREDKEVRKTLSGKIAGLQNAKILKHESEQHRKRENEMFMKMAKDISGRDTEVNVRDSKRRHKKLNIDPEKEARKIKIEKEKQEIYSRWGKGLKQIEDYKNKIADEQHEINKPFARYSDDADLDKVLKSLEREGDPMLDYIRKKKKDESKGLSMPTYEGSFPENRFNIRPGYRWDGVDRSNGYEKRWFEVQNKRIAIQEEAYKYSIEDM